MPRLNPITSVPACRRPPLSINSDYVTGRPRVVAWRTICLPGAGSHLILVMRTHLFALDRGQMDPASARYLIRINGHLGATFLFAFPAMASQWQGPETVLTGVLDGPWLYCVLAEIEALGLDLLEIRQIRK